MQLKHDIGELAGPALKGENPGSRWPKTSLAALRDRARLTPEQLQQLMSICRCVLSCVDEPLALAHVVVAPSNHTSGFWCREESAPLAADDASLRVRSTLCIAATGLTATDAATCPGR